MFKVIKNHHYGTKGLFKATEKGIVWSTFKQDVRISIGVRVTSIWVLALALASCVISGTLGSLCKTCIMRTWPYTFWSDTNHTRGPTHTHVHAHKHTPLWSILPDHFPSRSAHCPRRTFPAYLSSRPFRPPQPWLPSPKEGYPIKQTCFPLLRLHNVRPRTFSTVYASYICSVNTNLCSLRLWWEFGDQEVHTCNLGSNPNCRRN